MIRASIAHQAAEHIRNLIASGLVRPGQKIDQDAIASELGVSRAPVREALMTLGSEGLVTLLPRRGAFAAIIDQRDIEDHYAVYAWSHGLAAHRAATVIKPAQVERLKSLNATYASTTDAKELRQLDFDFHELINFVDASARLRAILQTLSRLSANVPKPIATPQGPQRQLAIAEHSDIISALASRNPDGARNACLNHLIREGTVVTAAWNDATLLRDAHGG